ncbi:MAG: nucleotide sugar dehydrogenase [Candidatus Moranbacteria bacterium]|jgi:nucleotide sugar dehydrogenase|nr:nucleotide sugar dehydrogenase [Candidatus Moranbacteria bacterium]MDD5652237.1 nucleotide sugar dehydrogenase [Candidatus Moranbacteria bacterium]MDX9856025.1 nucleotide sugar dehydrogenase [Candidatus Moranbacteria bacterium]
MKKQTVAVIGLGYVGLPLAVRAKEKGYDVIGIELDKNKIKLINKGISPIEDEFLKKNLSLFPIKATSDKKQIKKADIVLICVPTPVDKLHNPDLRPVRGASEMTAGNLKKGALVVLESTVNPGVSEEIVRPIFEERGHKIGKDVFIAHCPERINPGDPKWNVTNIPRVVGAFTKKGLKKAQRFYESIVDGEIRPMRHIREAEACKVVENSFRDINIAFVNELAKSFDKLGIDVKDVIDGASTKPFAFMAHYPSCGIGGHCIPVDPYYLIERAKQAGFDHKFLKTSREINNSMPEYTVELLQDKLNDLKMPLNGTNVGILGIAYKANVDDDRESPFYSIVSALRKHKARVHSFDPHLKSKSTCKSLEELLKKSEAIILATNHHEFEVINGKLLKKYGIKAVIDGKNVLDKKDIDSYGIIYKGIGR